LRTLIEGRGNAALAARINEWNNLLDDFSKTFSDRHPNVFIVIYDAFGGISDLLDEPVKHGFKDSLSVCATECIWYDMKHLGFRAHRYLAEELASHLDSDDVGIAMDDTLIEVKRD